MAAGAKELQPEAEQVFRRLISLLKQFDETRKMMKMMTKSGNVAKLMGKK